MPDIFSMQYDPFLEIQSVQMRGEGFVQTGSACKAEKTFMVSSSLSIASGQPGLANWQRFFTQTAAGALVFSPEFLVAV